MGPYKPYFDLKAGNYLRAYHSYNRMLDAPIKNPRSTEALAKLATKSVLGFTIENVHRDFLQHHIPKEAKLVVRDVIFDDFCMANSYVIRRRSDLVWKYIAKILNPEIISDDYIYSRLSKTLYEGILNLKMDGHGGMFEIYSSPSKFSAVLMDLGNGWNDFHKSLEFSRENQIEKKNNELSSSGSQIFTNLGTYVMAFLSNRMIVAANGNLWITNKNQPITPDNFYKFPEIPLVHYKDSSSPQIGTSIIMEFNKQ